MTSGTAASSVKIRNPGKLAARGDWLWQIWTLLLLIATLLQYGVHANCRCGDGGGGGAAVGAPSRADGWQLWGVTSRLLSPWFSLFPRPTQRHCPLMLLLLLLL